MDADRFRECLKALNWSQRGLARILDIQASTVMRWGMGTVPIPTRLAAWLETLAQCHEANPRPVKRGSADTG